MKTKLVSRAIDCNLQNRRAKKVAVSFKGSPAG